MTTFAYRSDKEPAIKVLMREAIQMSRPQRYDATSDKHTDLLPCADSDAEIDAPPRQEHSNDDKAPPLPPPPSDPASTETDMTYAHPNEHDNKLRAAMRAFKTSKPMSSVGIVDPVVQDEQLHEVPVAAPEHSTPGESASNGMAEWALQSIEGQTRTMTLAFEANIGTHIPSNHPIIHWMVVHAGFLLTVCHEDADGRTGYERWHGQRARLRMPEFGVVIMHYVPTKGRHDLDAKWRICVSSEGPTHQTKM